MGTLTRTRCSIHTHRQVLGDGGVVAAARTADVIRHRKQVVHGLGDRSNTTSMTPYVLREVQTLHHVQQRSGGKCYYESIASTRVTAATCRTERGEGSAGEGGGVTCRFACAMLTSTGKSTRVRILPRRSALYANRLM